MLIDFLYQKDSQLVLIDCLLSDTDITAKLVYCDKFIVDDTVALQDKNGREHTIIVPSKIKNLQVPYTGIHEGLFDFLLDS